MEFTKLIAVISGTRYPNANETKELHDYFKTAITDFKSFIEFDLKVQKETGFSLTEQKIFSEQGALKKNLKPLIEKGYISSIPPFPIKFEQTFSNVEALIEYIRIGSPEYKIIPLTGNGEAATSALSIIMKWLLAVVGGGIIGGVLSVGFEVNLKIATSLSVGIIALIFIILRPETGTAYKNPLLMICPSFLCLVDMTNGMEKNQPVVRLIKLKYFALSDSKKQVSVDSFGGTLDLLVGKFKRRFTPQPNTAMTKGLTTSIITKEELNLLSKGKLFS